MTAQPDPKSPIHLPRAVLDTLLREVYGDRIPPEDYGALIVVLGEAGVGINSTVQFIEECDTGRDHTDILHDVLGIFGGRDFVDEATVERVRKRLEDHSEMNLSARPEARIQPSNIGPDSRDMTYDDHRRVITPDTTPLPEHLAWYSSRLSESFPDGLHPVHDYLPTLLVLDEENIPHHDIWRVVSRVFSRPRESIMADLANLQTTMLMLEPIRETIEAGKQRLRSVLAR